MLQSIKVARLLRGGTTGFVAGCRVSEIDPPAFGALVRAPMSANYQVFGLIYDVHIDDDGLVRQLVSADHVSEEVMRDNRERRLVPIELSVLAVGYEQRAEIHHMLPPRPPLSLDEVYLCSNDELIRFTDGPRLGYLRHILQFEDAPAADLLAAHVEQASRAHADGGRWAQEAVREVITLLRDDYPTLVSVMGALNEVLPSSPHRSPV